MPGQPSRPDRERAPERGGGRLTAPSPVGAALVAALVAALADRAGSLTRGGAAAAWAVGTAVLVGTGWAGGAVLAAFFVSSSAVGRLLANRRPASGDAKGERRDARQVLANGGPAFLAALLSLGAPGPGAWAVTASLAAAAADTWATSAGLRSAGPARLLLLGPVVPAGTSGGMTRRGMLGALAGSLLVGVTGAAAFRAPALLPVSTLIGFAGMVADSALGAAAQGRFRCPACDETSEWRVHRCGTRTLRVGGVRWLDNDGVNLAATALAGAGGWGAWLLWCR